MSTSLLRVVERAQQDAEQGPEAIQSNGSEATDTYRSRSSTPLTRRWSDTSTHFECEDWPSGSRDATWRMAAPCRDSSQRFRKHVRMSRRFLLPRSPMPIGEPRQT